MFKKRRKPEIKKSYSQCGEDLIVQFIFDVLGIHQPSYLDVGAYHPYQLNNTALFYSKGSRGVNVEPNFDNYALFLSERKADTNLNMAVAGSKGELMYYQFDAATLNTLCPEEAKKTEAEGFNLVRSNHVPTDTIGSIINTHFPTTLEFLSLDIEGYEDVVIDGLRSVEILPYVICAETVEYSPDLSGVKKLELINMIETLGYRAYADTYINTIFIRKDVGL